ncbi:MAG: hypothetical protein NTNFB02_28530 [Nitrospira sp.]
MCLAVLPGIINEGSVLAVLGESASTVERDREILNGQRQSATESNYSVETINSPGMVIREYVSLDGLVFAVGWTQQKGIVNLEQLLGSYYVEYSRATLTQPRQSQRFRRVETEHAVIETGGRMGAVWGRAWVLSLLPGGISPDVIK